jgi:hypothetical protein
MKKITIILLGMFSIVLSNSFGQGTYTSGLVPIVVDLDAQIDINTDTDIVTLTLVGPESGWLAIAFDVPFGDEHFGQDLVMFDGTDLQDRTFTDRYEEPVVDSGGQDWTLVTPPTTAGGFTTVVATRARVSADPDDYVFSATPSTLDIAGAYNGNFTMSNKHDQKDFATMNFSLLGIDEIDQIDFSMVPNPVTGHLILVLPSNINKAKVEIYDMLARKIYTGHIKGAHHKSIDVSYLNSGVYLVKISDGNSEGTKRLVKQ